MNSLRTYIQCWTIKHLPLLPDIRRERQAKHLEKCLKTQNVWEIR
jgi:hypothetical protein